ncbi:MAG TPA: NPCBM/NEW2 domain-containing protein, partial [Thermoguttaceae bacterium]|nr:NPCBM/NEW2 domain-containing protein [Thermoguttaceae bacterium]
MQKIYVLTLVVFLAGTSASDATDREQRTASEWFGTHLIDCQMSESASAPVAVAPEVTKLRPPEPGLDVYANNDPVIAVAHGNRPMKIGERVFTRGLYAHATSKIVVQLPGPGKRFSALVGLDHNEDTARGQGSVVFSVTAGNARVFESEVMRFG